MTKEVRLSSSKKVLTDDEMREFYRKLFELFWGKVEPKDLNHCFDCGKELKRDNDRVVMMDCKGFLVFCSKCTFHRMEIRDTWRKIFH